MADWEISQLSVKSSPAAATDYLPLLDTLDTSTAPAGAGGSDKRATVTSVVNSVQAFAPKGLTGAVQAARFAGATASGAPVSGTFAVGDFIVDQTGIIWLCTAAGTPGTWVALYSTAGGQAIAGNLIVNNPSHYANGTFVGQSDGAQYSNFNLADNIYPLDALGHYWAFSHRADAPAHRLLIFNYNGSAYTNVMVITEAGAITTLHSTLEDGNGNASFGATVTPGAGAATYPPLKLLSGTLMTTAAAGAAEYDGTCFYATAQASSRQVADTEQFTTLTSPYTLASQTAAQKMFNATANGALTVQGSTAYWFECFFTLSSMSASSGSFGFALGGTATLTSQMWETEANKAALATAASAQNTVNTAANTAIATATTNTVGWAKIWGKVRVNAAGTLIPQVSLGVAAAAVVGADSYFRIWPAGASGVTNVGNWS